MTLGTLITAFPVLGILAGLARTKFRRAPVIAAGLVVAAYGVYMLTIGIWAVQCWDCRGLSETRGEAFTVAAIFFGVIAGTTLLGIWLGARLSVMLSRLLRTLRELRDGIGKGRTGAANEGNT